MRPVHYVVNGVPVRGKISVKCGHLLCLAHGVAISDLPWPPWEHICPDCLDAQHKDVHQPPLVLATGTIVKRRFVAT